MAGRQATGDAVEPDRVRDQPLERVGAAAEERERSPHVTGRVVERAAQRDLLVVDPVRVDLDACVPGSPPNASTVPPGRTSRSASAQASGGRLPRSRRPRRPRRRARRRRVGPALGVRVATPRPRVCRRRPRCTRTASVRSARRRRPPRRHRTRCPRRRRRGNNTRAVPPSLRPRARARGGRGGG